MEGVAKWLSSKTKGSFAATLVEGGDTKVIILRRRTVPVAAAVLDLGLWGVV